MQSGTALSSQSHISCSLVLVGTAVATLSMASLKTRLLHASSSRLCPFPPPSKPLQQLTAGTII